MKKFLASTTAVVALASYSAIGFAQEADSSANTEDDKYTLGTVTVTARKVEENLQTTPVAVTAFTADELEVRGVADVSDIGKSSPNVQITTSGNAGPSGASDAPSVFIRGIGLNDFTINTDPAVGLYVDNVYLGRSVGSVLDLLDLERVEVLRGPQGTLFGANNIGGAVSLITAKPTTEGTFGDVSVLVGQESWFEVQGKANLPLGDKAALRVSGLVRQRDGFVTASQYNDLKLGNDDMWAVRGALRFEPTSDLTIDLTADYAQSREAPAATVGVGIGPAVGTDIPEFSRPANAFNNNNGIAACATPNYGGPIPASAATNPGCFSSLWATNPEDRVSHSVWLDRNANVITPENEFDIYGFSATVEWDTEIGTFKSISAARGFESVFYNDIDHTPLPVFGNNNSPYDQDQISQEFQFNGRFFEDRLDLTLGAFYFSEEGEENVEIIFGGTPFGAPFTPPAGPFNILDTAGGAFFQDNNRKIENEQIALFAQGTYDITDTVHLTGGFRWTQSDKSYLTELDRSAGSAGFGSLGPASADISTEEISPLVTLAWDASETVYTYVTYSEGYRDGGWSARFLGGLPDPLPNYDPEYVTAYEAGIKADLTDSLRVNAAIFRTDYEDYQIVGSADLGAQTSTSTTLIIGEAELTGAEVEVLAVITPNFRIDWSLGLLDAEIAAINSVDGTFTTEGFIVDTSHSLPFTPDITSNLGLNYNIELPNGADLSTRVDWRYVGDQYYRVENGPNQFQDAYSDVNLSLTYDPEAPWKATLGVRNLFDEFYTTGANISGTAAVESVGVNRPLTAFVKLAYEFGE